VLKAVSGNSVWLLHNGFLRQFILSSLPQNHYNFSGENSTLPLFENRRLCSAVGRNLYGFDMLFLEEKNMEGPLCTIPQFTTDPLQLLVFGVVFRLLEISLSTTTF